MADGTPDDIVGPLPPQRLEDEFTLALLDSEDVVTALDSWRQGDLVSGLRLMWAVPACGDALFGDEAMETARPGWEGVVCDLPSVDASGADPRQTALDFGIVTTQTCDIGALGPGRKHPTVQVSPLLRLDQLGPSQAASVRAGKTKYFVHVTAVPAPGEWAVDLRISIPVSKGVLCLQERTHGFTNEQQSLEFANRIASRYARPAMHDAVEEYLVPRLRALVGAATAAGQTWPERVEQFRLRVTGGTRLAPTELELIAVLDGDLTPEERQPLRDWLEGERAPFESVCGASMTPVRFLPLDLAPVRDYRDAVPLDVRELGRPPYL